jgi:signal transduction histidine kinase
VWVAASSPGGSPERLAFALWSPVLAGVSTVAGGVAYVLFRGAVLVWPVWDRLRRTRLLWALTHAQLVAGLLLVAVVAALLTTTDYLAGVRGPPFGPENLPADAGTAAVLVAWVATRLLPAATALLLLGVAAAVVVLPPVALISFLVLRRTTDRLGGLVDAAEALRTGHLAARVPVGGEDEVARLQVTFNAMAADLERTLRDLQDERDRVAGLLEARRQLVAGVSHELRTPVATVRGYLESALRRDGAVPADLRADLETVEREVARLQRLIEDLFTLSRAEVGRLELRPEPTDAGAVVRRLVATTAPLAWRRRRVEVLADVAPDLPPAHADAQRLEQIVSNLLGNAVRHTPPGGLVAAAVAAEPDAVRVEIRDTGEGIAPEDLPRVFERFYRGRNGDGHADDGASPGAGLGLALTKELTEAMGGSVEAASTPGEGSRFTVRLPRA